MYIQQLLCFTELYNIFKYISWVFWLLTFTSEIVIVDDKMMTLSELPYYSFSDVQVGESVHVLSIAQDYVNMQFTFIQ